MKKAVETFTTMLLISCAYLNALHAQTSEMQADRARRDLAIRWPAAFDPSVAPVFSHNELLIHADCHRTFAHLADARSWPNWLVIVKDVANETPGNTEQGALFHLRIFGSPIQSRIVEYQPDQRISWIPFGADETETHHGHYHAWHLVRQGADCLVITEETGIGPGDRKDPASGSHLCTKRTNSGSIACGTSANHNAPLLASVAFGYAAEAKRDAGRPRRLDHEDTSGKAHERGLRPSRLPCLTGIGHDAPSTRKFAPVMKSDRGLERHATMFATSAGEPIFPAAKRLSCT